MTDAPEAGSGSRESPEFSGTWERSGRSLNAAAVAGLLGIGLLYSYGASILVTIIMLAQGRLELGVREGESLFAMLERIAELKKNPIRISAIFSQAFLMFIPTLWIVRRWHTPDVRAYLRWRPVPARAVILAALSAILFFPTNAYLSSLFVGALKIPDELIAINQRLFSSSGPAEFLFLVVAIGLTPAICEETLFRGYVQRTFERTIGWKSVVLVGVIFGLFHMQPMGLFSLSGLGVIIGFFYYKSRSLLPGMAAHFTNNVLALLLDSPVRSMIGIDLKTPHLGIVLLTLPVAGMMVYLFYKTFGGGTSE